MHNVDRSAKLSNIIELLLKIDNEDSLYVPRKGIYWLRKGNKQPVLLKTDEDLETCKKEYGTGSIRIACSVVDVGSSSGTCLIWIFNTHCSPQSPQSIWAVPRIEISGQSQFLSMCKVLVLYFQPLKFVRCDIESVNHRLLVFDAARGLNPWRCLNGLRSLGKRMCTINNWV